MLGVPVLCMALVRIHSSTINKSWLYFKPCGFGPANYSVSLEFEILVW
jgi:hypothetical protein